MEGQLREYWEVWYPKAGATGLLVARCFVDAAASVMLHAPPEVLTAEVRNQAGDRLAYGKDLAQTLSSPMCRLRRQGDVILREDFWPEESDLGSIVIVPGGEAGVLKSWWHAEDRMEWRWQLEFYNSLR